ncbi:MAG TPA: NifU family protein [Acidimicrobiales bacterium]|jgi:Fe/S biogenesis protein NfuA|nr:NifU family protein [Acidimicrobiales bacterium]
MEDAAADTATHEPATHDPADPVTDEHVSDEVDPEPSEPARAVPMRVTPDALSQVMSILAAEDDPESLGLRIAVTGVQGVEYAYDLSFEDRTSATDDDLVYNQGDLVVMIPRDSVDALWGATLDLPSTAGQGGLVIRNPNRPDPLADFDIELTGTVEERIDQLLAQQINPALASHGGFASLVEVLDGTRAVVTMGGGCQGCAVSALTLRDGIEKAILQHVPEITEVLDATDHAAGESPFYSE